jgi:hypothetical protein
MTGQIEFNDSSNESLNFVNNSQITLVMCHGCKQRRPINNEYAGYVTGGIASCRFCRNSSEER